MKRMREDRAWHLDKKVPIALIVAIFAQTGGMIWWASSLNQRVSSLEQSQAVTASSAPLQSDRLARVEVKVETVQRDVTEIKADIKSLVRKGGT